MARLVTLGEALGIVRTSVGTFTLENTATVSTCGAEANVAIAAARLGASTIWIGRVGDDSIGRRVVRTLRAEDVDVVAHIDRDAPTGLLLKEAPRPGASRVTYYRTGSAGSRLEPDDLAALVLHKSDVLHLTGITPALSHSALATIRRAFDLAETAGCVVSYDINHRGRLWTTDDAARVHRELIERADIVFASMDEAQTVIGASEASPEEVAHRLAALGPDTAVIKLGIDGAIALHNNQFYKQPAHPVSTVLDTVGAGDAFAGAYLAELLAGSDIPVLLKTACIAGALACLSPGDWEGSPTRSDLELLSLPDPVDR